MKTKVLEQPYLNEMTKTYNEKYAGGYGCMYPESHVIRFYVNFLKYQFNIEGNEDLKVLDFGCGNGTHPKYFKEQGFDVYGMDIIPQAIQQAKQRNPHSPSQFKCIKAGDDITNVFDTKFDIIIANQSIYYLSDEDLNDLLAQFDAMLNEGGIVYLTMAGTENYYYEMGEPLNDGSGLTKVVHGGRLDETVYINFIDSEEELREKFEPFFKTDFVGHYDVSLREGSGFHWQYIGLKK